MDVKKYGIRVRLPPEDFLNAPHLLGGDWEGYRWFDTAEQRDEQYHGMLALPRYYQRDELPLQVLTKVEQEDDQRIIEDGGEADGTAVRSGI